MKNIKKIYLDISLLIAVHFEIKPSQLKVSIESIFLQNSIPKQIIIIADGPINSNLSKYLSEICNKYNQILILNLKKNKGLAYALNYAMEKSNYELIARLDPDDEIINDRFLIQKKVFDEKSNLSICGSFIQEKSKNKSRLIQKPLTDNDIKISLKVKNPIIHSTVMFKKSCIIQVGGYPSIFKCQDYLLWVKCMEKKNTFKNLDKALVITKLDKELMRRRNLSYFLYEKKIYEYMLQKGVINNYIFSLNIISRFILRLLPYPLKFFLYNIR